MSERNKFLNYLNQINLNAYQYYGDNINIDNYEFQMVLHRYINLLSNLNESNNKDNYNDGRGNSFHTQNHPNNSNHPRPRPTDDDFEP